MEPEGTLTTCRQYAPRLCKTQIDELTTLYTACSAIVWDKPLQILVHSDDKYMDQTHRRFPWWKQKQKMKLGFSAYNCLGAKHDVGSLKSTHLTCSKGAEGTSLIEPFFVFNKRTPLQTPLQDMWDAPAARIMAKAKAKAKVRWAGEGDGEGEGDKLIMQLL